MDGLGAGAATGTLKKVFKTLNQLA